MTEKKYMFAKTGSVDTAENWTDGYPGEELQERGVSAKTAFIQDLKAGHFVEVVSVADGWEET